MPGFSALNKRTPRTNPADARYDANGAASAAIASSAQKANNGSDFADPGSTRSNLQVPMLGPCKAVATANITLSGTQVVDGYAAGVGDQILASAQTLGAQNGPWVVATGAWTRPTDYASGSVIKGRMLQVNTGSTANIGLWTMLASTSVTVDTTATTWVPAGQARNDARYDVAGAAATAQTAAQAYTDSETTRAQTAELLAAKKSANLSDLTSTSTARANISAAKSGVNSDITSLTGLTTPLAVSEGGTGSASQNFVDLSTAQTVAGVKTFSSAPVVPAASFPESAVTGLVADLAAKAPLASPTFTGTVTTPVPVNATDAATKAYVDSVAAGLSTKASCRVATTASLPANTYASGVLTANAFGALTVDTVAVSVGDRINVKNETAQANNGLYVVTATGSAGATYVLTRTSDMNTGAQIPGAFVFIEQGSANSSSGWVVGAAGPYTLGTTAIIWTQFSGAGEITVDSTLTEAGNQISRSAITGDVSVPAGSNVATLATANANTGSFGTASQVPTLTLDGKGRTTAAANTSIQIAESQVTGLTADLAARSTTLVLKPVQTASFTAVVGNIYPINANNAVIVTLPTAPADKSIVQFKVTIGSTVGLPTGGQLNNPVIYNTGGSDVINVAGGVTTGHLYLLDQAVTLQYDQTTAVWIATGDDLPLAQLDARYGPSTLDGGAPGVPNTDTYDGGAP